MSSPSTSRRVSARKVAKSITASAKPRRKVGKRAHTARGSEGESNALLIAQFAEALGGASAPRKKRNSRSLMAALQGPSPADSIFAAMPGVRVDLPASLPPDAAEFVPAPCLAVHRRHRLHARLARAGSYCFAILVSAGIIGATAFGLVSQAPRGDHATLALSETAKARSL